MAEYRHTMITGAIKSQIDQVWNAFWSGGIAEVGLGGVAEIDRARAESKGLGLFVRSLVGMDREAAKEALGGFVAGRTLSANQIDFVNLIVIT
jgi:hypothetical protein